MSQELDAPNLTQDPSIQAGNRTISPEQQVVGQAIEFFNQNFRLNLDGEGHMFDEPSSEQLANLRDWHLQTKEDGHDMANIDTFTAKTVLARALMPQQDAQGNIQYLFGRGVGVELALQGQVEGRTKQLDQVPYRSHDDFEIYAAPEANYDAIEHGKRFKAVFGGQEIYPTTKTKSLRELPADYLQQTAEVVNYGGLDFLVPSLEAQFVDKFESGNPKKERELRGQSDAELLAKTYQLDAAKIHDLVDDHVIMPQLNSLKVPSEVAQDTSQVLQIKIKQAAKRNAQSGSLSQLVDAIKQDPALLNYAQNHAINDLGDLIDGTGALKPDAVFALTAAETNRQLGIYQKLASHHSQIDSLLQAA